ncbi:hypothetical protein LEMLEM_LOCUS14223 [Lemmus lemmus]
MWTWLWYHLSLNPQWLLPRRCLAEGLVPEDPSWPRTWIKTASHHTGLKWVGWPVIFNEELFKYQREAVFGGSSLESLIDRGRTRMMAASLRRQEEGFTVLKNAGCVMLLQNQKDTTGSPGDWQLANQETASPPPLPVSVCSSAAG